MKQQASVTVKNAMNNCPNAVCRARVQSKKPSLGQTPRWRQPVKGCMTVMIDQVQSRSRGRRVLMHGSPYPQQILGEGKIRATGVDGHYVSLTRQPAIGVRLATLPRDGSEGRGAVFLLDRELLQHRFRIDPYLDEGWVKRKFPTDEAEERIYERDVDELYKYLIDVIWTPPCDQFFSWFGRSINRLSIAEAAAFAEMPVVKLQRLIEIGEGPRVERPTLAMDLFKEQIFIGDLQNWINDRNDKNR